MRVREMRDTDGQPAEASPEGRAEAFDAAAAAGDWDRAHEIARAPLPPTWPEDVRRSWGGRRGRVRVSFPPSQG